MQPHALPARRRFRTSGRGSSVKEDSYTCEISTRTENATVIFLMDPEALRFPVLALAQDGSIVPVDSPATLRQCNAIAFWRNHYYDGMVIIDADEKTWLVTQALPILPAGTVGRAMARLVNGKVQVHLVLEPDTGPDGLAMAKSRVSRWMDRDGDFWEASADLDEWKARVDACPTIDALIELFR